MYYPSLNLACCVAFGADIYHVIIRTLIDMKPNHCYQKKKKYSVSVVVNCILEMKLVVVIIVAHVHTSI